MVLIVCVQIPGFAAQPSVVLCNTFTPVIITSCILHNHGLKLDSEVSNHSLLFFTHSKKVEIFLEVLQLLSYFLIFFKLLFTSTPPPFRLPVFKLSSLLRIIKFLIATCLPQSTGYFPPISSLFCIGYASFMNSLRKRVLHNLSSCSIVPNI